MLKLHRCRRAPCSPWASGGGPAASSAAAADHPSAAYTLNTHTLGGARTRGDRPRGRGARPTERRRRAEWPGQPGGRRTPAERRGPHGGEAPERPNRSARTTPTSAGSMARWAALGPLGAGARWGRGAAPCACALRRSGLVRTEGEQAGVTCDPGLPAAGLTGSGPSPPGGPAWRRRAGGRSLPEGPCLPNMWPDQVNPLGQPSGK